jgi:hypothetical protein
MSGRPTPRRAAMSRTAPASASAPHACLLKAASRLPNDPRPETPRAPHCLVCAALWTVGPFAVRPVARTPEAPPSVHRSRAGAHVAYKGPVVPLPRAPSRLQLLCSARAPPSEAAAAKPRGRPAAWPTEAPSTFSHTCCSSSTCSFSPPRRCRQSHGHHRSASPSHLTGASPLPSLAATGSLVSP